ncbi:HK97 gp10 family phage protein [Inconstantimicrobium mannanitabidum]|uniref:Uncharacterized protein n=1 Tax=Inconstantimicrobium mannanitabidum TaxID=1604901 RepID=A0ACB5R9H4_9CLOT|nr:HK97 gp10 family phage protein [Clostridium sp. TW13]GKX65834.1 hypothetical protein rsdtw13_10920 [Clostridium sp. TW13]
MILKDNTDKVVELIKKTMNGISKEVGTTLLADMQSGTPVLTGNLRRAETFIVENKDNTFKVILGVDKSIVYAAKVEFENKSYMRSTIDKDKQKIEDIIKKNLGGAMK